MKRWMLLPLDEAFDIVVFAAFVESLHAVSAFDRKQNTCTVPTLIVTSFSINIVIEATPKMIGYFLRYTLAAIDLIAID